MTRMKCIFLGLLILPLLCTNTTATEAMYSGPDFQRQNVFSERVGQQAVNPHIWDLEGITPIYQGHFQPFESEFLLDDTEPIYYIPGPPIGGITEDTPIGNSYWITLVGAILYGLLRRKKLNLQTNNKI